MLFSLVSWCRWGPGRGARGGGGGGAVQLSRPHVASMGGAYTLLEMKRGGPAQRSTPRGTQSGAYRPSQRDELQPHPFGTVQGVRSVLYPAPKIGNLEGQGTGEKPGAGSGLVGAPGDALAQRRGLHGAGHGARPGVASCRRVGLSLPRALSPFVFSVSEGGVGNVWSVLCVRRNPVCKRLSPPRSGKYGMPGRRSRLGGVADGRASTTRVALVTVSLPNTKWPPAAAHKESPPQMIVSLSLSASYGIYRRTVQAA